MTQAAVKAKGKAKSGNAALNVNVEAAEPKIKGFAVPVFTPEGQTVLGFLDDRKMGAENISTVINLKKGTKPDKNGMTWYVLSLGADLNHQIRFYAGKKGVWANTSIAEMQQAPKQAVGKAVVATSSL